MPRMRKPKGPKAVNYRLIKRDQDDSLSERMYRMLDELVAEHHDELAEARIALAFVTDSWKPDVDGRKILGKCKKATDLDREIAEFDFIILLDQSFWCSDSATDKMRRALLDHELMHATVKYQKDDPSEPELDVRGRIVYRIRRHDLEEFADIVERYGCWKSDIEKFARAIERGKQGGLLDEKKETPAVPARASSVDRITGVITEVTEKLADTSGDLRDIKNRFIEKQREIMGPGGSVSFSTVRGGRRVGTHITADAVTAIDEPADSSGTESPGHART